APVHYVRRGFVALRGTGETSVTASLVMLDTLRNSAVTVTDERQLALLRSEGERLLEQARIALSGHDLHEVQNPPTPPLRKRCREARWLPGTVKIRPEAVRTSSSWREARVHIRRSAAHAATVFRTAQRRRSSGSPEVCAVRGRRARQWPRRPAGRSRSRY